ncbi:MAG: peptide/nickel transport system substrate-binding protein [Patescibacteria group bacterium]|nr:peptide/nickel transport system substrate-binding protein [Patescibacteria group bacterium]
MIKQNKWPSKKQWLQFFRILGKKERIFFGLLFVIFITSLSICLHSFYIDNTIIVPANYGHIKEGVVGQPQLINPLYSSISDTDKDLVELIFSGLMKYNGQGEIVPDLISNYTVENGGRNIVFSIKENVKWHDGTPLTIDDVIFTIELVQKTEYSSPLRTNWLGVEIEKMSEYDALLTLRQTYTGFKESLVNLKIMPKHIWEEKTFQAMTSNIQLNIFNPIGSGPYKIEKVNQNGDKTIKSIVLQRNNYYYDNPPYISRVELFFFNNEDELKRSYERGKINSASIAYHKDAQIIKMPSYYNLFLNNQRKPLDNKEIRQALTLLTQRELESPFLSSFYGLDEIEETLSFDEEQGINLLEKNGYLIKEGTRTKTIERSSGFQFTRTLQVGSNNAEVRKLQECLSENSDIYPSGTISGYFGQKTKDAVILFQEKYKEDILVPNNLTSGNGVVKASTIKKLNEVCFVVPEEEIKMSFVLKTTTHPELIKTANNIKEQWEKYGIEIEVKTYDASAIKRVITNRDFDILLFGVQLGGILEPTPFYHSSQRVDPGLNLSLYQSTKADEIIEKIRTLENEERLNALSELEALIIEDAPVIPLYAPNYHYIINKNLKGFTIEKIVDPSKRFVEINKWYIKEKRIWK